MNEPATGRSPLARSRLARLVWTQIFKRSPVNLRRLARVPAGRNAKGTALFALAYLSHLRAVGMDNQTRDETRREATTLLGELIEARIETGHGAADRLHAISMYTGLRSRRMS